MGTTGRLLSAYEPQRLFKKHCVITKLSFLRGMTVFLSFGQSDEGHLSRYGPQNLLASFVQMCYNT